jgi:hypothetical protein
MVTTHPHDHEKRAGKWPAAGQSVGTIEVGDRTYPLVSESRCKTCRSPHRLEIETDIVNGAGYAAVAGLYDDDDISARGIKRHFRRGHLPLLADAVHKLKTREAERRGQIIDEASRSLVSLLQVASLVVGKVHEDVMSGKVRPTLRDGAQFSRLLLMADQSAAEVDWSIVKIGLSACIQVVRDTLDDRAFEQFVDTVTSHAEVKLLLDQVGPLKVH